MQTAGCARPAEQAAQNESAGAADQDQAELQRDAQVAQRGKRDDDVRGGVAKQIQRVDAAPEARPTPSSAKTASVGSQPRKCLVTQQANQRIESQHDVERPEQQVNAPQQGGQDDKQRGVPPVGRIQPADQKPQAGCGDAGAQRVGPGIGGLVVDASHRQADKDRKPCGAGMNQPGSQTSYAKQSDAHQQDRWQSIGDFGKSEQRFGGARQLVIDGIGHLGRDRKGRMIGSVLDDENAWPFRPPRSWRARASATGE